MRSWIDKSICVFYFLQLFGKIAFFIGFVYNTDMIHRSIFIWVFCCITLSAYTTYAEGWVWEGFGIGFYSSIHNNIDATVTTLRDKELKKYSTFSWFWSHCRAKNPAIDNERMDKELLIEVSYGITSRLMKLILKNNWSIDSNSLLNLSTCLAETYRMLWEQAQRDEKSLTQISAIWIYTDGDTKNSDYDIIADIEKINGIIFTEKLDYNWTQNNASSSYRALVRWDNIPSIFTGMTGVTLRGGIIVSSWSLWDSFVSWSLSSVTPSLSDLWASAICSVRDTTSTVSWSSVTNMVDDAFLRDLSSILGGYNPGPLGTPSYGYGDNLWTKNALWVWTKAGSDFFDSPTCSGNFCIKIKTIKGSTNVLAGGKTYSIESLIEKHSKTMEPISNSNLSAQKHQTNSFQLPFLNIKLKNKISWAQVSMEDRPQLQKKFIEEYTQAIQDEEFEYMRRCAYASAGLPWDKNRANIPSWVWYQFITIHNSESTNKAKKVLWTINPDDSSIWANCMDIALGKSKEEYYASMNTDLTEFEVFTTALIGQISKWLQVDGKLDTLRSK